MAFPVDGNSVLAPLIRKGHSPEGKLSMRLFLRLGEKKIIVACMLLYSSL